MPTAEVVPDQQYIWGLAFSKFVYVELRESLLHFIKKRIETEGAYTSIR